MDCFLSNCHEQMFNGYVATVVYSIAVLTMVSLAAISRSKTIQHVAMLIGGAWIVSSFVHNFWTSIDYFQYSVLIDVFMAYQFWRLARSDMFPAPLCILMIAEIVFTIAAITTSFSVYWTYFVLNRVLDVMLLYVIGCSLLRLYLLRVQEKTDEPLTGWRAHFAAI